MILIHTRTFTITHYSILQYIFQAQGILYKYGNIKVPAEFCPGRLFMNEIAHSNTLDIFQVESLKYILSFSKCLLGDKKGAQVYHGRKSTGAQN